MIRKIGVTSCFFHPDPDRNIFKNRRLLYAEESMMQYLLAEGMFPVLIPTLDPNSKITPEEIMTQFDGLLLQGGDDMASESYGQKPISSLWPGDKFRDDYEMALTKIARKQNKPILGICRGAQVINATFGGTLFQDIATQKEDALTHRDRELYSTLYHDIEFTEGGLLNKAYKSKSGITNSVHHQAIQKVADGFSIEAFSPKDGIIEAIRLTEKAPSEKNLPFILAVQWHPEFQTKEENQLICPKIPIKLFSEAILANEKG